MGLRRVGNYILGDAFAEGGMATVHLGRRQGAEGWGRTVAIKRIRSEHTKGHGELVTLLLREARLSSRLRHQNIVSVVDLVEENDEFLLVTEYVHGFSLAQLLRDAGAQPVPLDVASAIGGDLLRGLHSAHQLAHDGESLQLVHRDVSPENVLVGADGIGRLIDFGIARTRDLTRYTKTGEVRGKVAYLASEHLNGGTVDARTDVYAAAVVIWELLAGRRLFEAETVPELIEQIGIGITDPLRRYRPQAPAAVDALLTRALSADPRKRPPSALALARDLEAALAAARPEDVARWIEKIAGRRLEERALLVADFERSARAHMAQPSGTPPAPPPAAAARPRRTARLAAGVFVAVGALACAALFRHPHVPESPRVAAPVTAPSPSETVVVAPPASPNERERDERSLSTHSRRRAPSKPVSAARPRPECDPPYERDATGNKIYKPHCL